MIEEVYNEITTTHGSVPWGAKDTVKTAKKKEPTPADHCPIMGIRCGKTCAAYDGGSCDLLTGGKLNASGICPVTKIDCKPATCIMYNDGKCSLFMGKGDK